MAACRQSGTLAGGQRLRHEVYLSGARRFTTVPDRSALHGRRLVRDGHNHTRSEQPIPSVNPPAVVKQQGLYGLIVLDGSPKNGLDHLDVGRRATEHETGFITDCDYRPSTVPVRLDRDGAGIIRDKARATLMNTESLGTEIHRKILREEAEDSAEHLEAGEKRGKRRRGRREGKYPVVSCCTGSQVPRPRSQTSTERLGTDS